MQLRKDFNLIQVKLRRKYGKIEFRNVIDTFKKATTHNQAKMTIGKDSGKQFTRNLNKLHSTIHCI